MKIGVHQSDIHWEDVAANMAALSEQVQRSQDEGCDLCLLPEMFPCGFSMRSREMAKACQGVPDTMLKLAQTHKIWIGGSYPSHKAQGLPSNCLSIASPDGTLTSYEKLHPFSLAKESQHYSAGQGRVNLTIKDLRCTLFVCYDLRFANAFWEMAPHTDAYLVVANWPAKRRFAWNRLLSARAIENQAFVVGCNRVGHGNGLSYSGDSCILGPLGKPICSARGQVAHLVADLRPQEVAKLREKLPFLQDRRELPPWSS